jgi:hypothetical protein
VFGVGRSGKQRAAGAEDADGSSAKGSAKESAKGTPKATAKGTPQGTGKASTDGGKAPAGGDAGKAAADGNGKAAAGQSSGNGSAGGDGAGTRGGRRPSGRAIVIGAAAACVAGAGIGYAVSQQGSPSGSSSANLVPAATGPMRLDSVTPAAGSTGVNGAGQVVVTFSEPVAPNTTDPTLKPSVPGTWSAQGDSLIFTPTTAFAPLSRETVTVSSGIRSSGGVRLGNPKTEHFTTEGYSVARLAQLLGQLGYLPLTWSPQITGVGRIEVPEQGAEQNTSEQALAYDPPVGSFSWDTGYPSMLSGMWSPGQPNVIVRGAVMAFQSQHGMTINGDVTQRFWSALFTAADHQADNKNGYTYAIASKGSPETLTIWHNGHQVLQSLTNTGIPVSPTVDGTFPVYLRLPFQIMQGQNPDGSSYADPVWWVSYFNGGDAVHYFPRGSYGWPQSLGCVELPWNDARAAYPYLTYGSLVTVAG